MLVRPLRLRAANRRLDEARRHLDQVAYAPGPARTVAYERLNRLKRDKDRLLELGAGSAR